MSTQELYSPLTVSTTKAQDDYATIYHRAVLGHLAKHVLSDSSASELFDTVLTPMEQMLPRSSMRWQPETGAVMKRIREKLPHEAVVTALLGLHSLGGEGSWETRLEKPIWVSFGGHILHLDGHVSVSANATTMIIAVGKHRDCSVSFSRRTSGWRLADEIAESEFQYGAPTFIGVPDFENVYIHPWLEPERPNPIVDWPIATVKDRNHELASVAVSHITDALHVIRAAGEQYVRWIRPLFRGVAATPLTYDDMRQSGSADEHPGLFSCGFPGHGPESTAEVIIHELSHQHYILMNTISPLAIDSSTEEHFSSFKGASRPLSRVFLAYHAAANMALFWSDLSKTRALDIYYLTEQRRINEHVQNLGKVLRDASGLTAAGKALFAAQDELLTARGLAAC